MNSNTIDSLIDTLSDTTIDTKTLSSDDIYNIVKNKLKTTDFELLNYTLEPFAEKIGLLGDHASLKITIQDSTEQQPKELHFFVKFFPAVPVSANFARETGAFDKEIFANEVLFTKIQSVGIELIKQCTVECHLKEKERVLVFDDLIKAGFETPSKYKEFDFATALSVLKSLAKLHASSLVYEEMKSKELGRDYRLIEDYEKQFEETFYNDRDGFINIKGVEASIKGILTEIDLFQQPPKLMSGKYFKTVAEKCCYKVYDLVKPSKRLRNVVSHGDLWSSNLFFKYKDDKPIECKMVDFQMTRYAPPSHDVVSILHLTTSREFRQRHMYELIGLYYAALESNLKLAGYDVKSIVPFSDFLQSCEKQKQFALMQAATYFQLIFVDSDALKEFYANHNFSSYALYEDRSVLILAHVDKHNFYRRKLQESIEDLREYCEGL